MKKIIKGKEEEEVKEGKEPKKKRRRWNKGSLVLHKLKNWI